MSVREVSSGRARAGGRERASVLALAGLIIGGIGIYVAMRATADGDDRRNLLPYQSLERTLPEPERQAFATLRQGMLLAEDARATSGRWPGADALAAQGVAPFADAGSGGLRWRNFQEGTTIQYLGVPVDPAAPAWLLAIKEPDPNGPPDLSPEDDEHRRLPDGTMLHRYLWLHRYGGRVPAAFVAQPEASGWTHVLIAPPNPVVSVPR